MNSLISCKSSADTKPIIAVDNYCIIASPITASVQDKKELKKSGVSKEFIEKIVNHNDTWKATCQ